MKEIQILEPDLNLCSVKITTSTSYPICQSGIGTPTSWEQYFFTLTNRNYLDKEAFSRCYSILKWSSFCGCDFVEVYNDTDIKTNTKIISFTFSFETIEYLKKFINSLQEKVPAYMM